MDNIMIGPLALYSFVCTATPGPNNIMLASSGLVFGFRRTMPHILGISMGCTVMLVLSGLGLAVVFQAVPMLQWVIRIAGAAYLLWLAARLWRVRSIAAAGAARPLGFWQAAAFQFVNPKAWAITISAIAGFAVPGRPIGEQITLITAVFIIGGLPWISCWAALGAAAREWLGNETAMRLFIRAMAVLTALTAIFFLV